MKTRMVVLAIAGRKLSAAPAVAQEAVDAGTIEVNEDQITELYNV